MSKRATQKRFAEAIAASGGNYSLIAEMLDMPRYEVVERIQGDRRLADALEEVRGTDAEYAKTLVLFCALKLELTWANRWLLYHYAVERGFGTARAVARYQKHKRREALAEIIRQARNQAADQGAKPKSRR